MVLFDSHAHVDADDFAADRDEVIARARAAGVERIVAVGLWRKPGDFGGARALAEAHPGVFFATAGVHPHDCAHVPDADWAALEALVADPRTIAVGETGLDYHYDHSPRDAQRRWFRHQLVLAKRHGKPVVIHTREADDDTAAILREERPPSGIVHCFTGGPDRARAYLDLGLHISIAGVVTFKNAQDLREAAKLVPADRLLVETDCPYLAPIPHRGKRNEPAHVKLVVEELARLRGEDPGELAARTAANAARVFRL